MSIKDFIWLERKAYLDSIWTRLDDGHYWTLIDIRFNVLIAGHIFYFHSHDAIPDILKLHQNEVESFFIR